MVRKNRREKQCHTLKSLKLRCAMIKNRTLGVFSQEVRLAFLENTVVLLVEALERRKRKAKK